MKILFQIRKLYWQVRRPVVLGSFSIVIKDERVLLVRHTYQQGWFLPGGGVRKGESFLQGAVRELKEECGIIAINPSFQNVHLNELRGAIDHVAVFIVESFDGQPTAADRKEIAEVRFFPFDELPADLKRGHRDRIFEYLRKKESSDMW